MLGRPAATRDNARIVRTAPPPWRDRFTPTNIFAFVISGIMVAAVPFIPDATVTDTERHNLHVVVSALFAVGSLLFIGGIAHDMNRYRLARELVAAPDVFCEVLSQYRVQVPVVTPTGNVSICDASNFQRMTHEGQLGLAWLLLRHMSYGDRRWYTPCGFRNRTAPLWRPAGGVLASVLLFKLVHLRSNTQAHKAQ